jgi:hypothetical protein
VSPGEIKAYVWPRRALNDKGFGCVDYAAVLVNEHGEDRLITSTDETWDAIEDAIEEYAPVLQMLRSRQVTLNASNQTVDVTLELADNAPESMRCDWDAESVQTAVNTSTVLTRRVAGVANVCAPTVTDGLEEGHRVIIAGEEAVVDAVNIGADAKVFSVQAWPSEWGTADNAIAGQRIMSGGVSVNDALMHVAQHDIPFGGVGPSGVGAAVLAERCGDLIVVADKFLGLRDARLLQSHVARCGRSVVQLRFQPRAALRLIPDCQPTASDDRQRRGQRQAQWPQHLRERNSCGAAQAFAAAGRVISSGSQLFCGTGEPHREEFLARTRASAIRAGASRDGSAGAGSCGNRQHRTGHRRE